MSEMKVENKQIVVPGEVLAEGLDFLPSYGTYREGDKILASRVGMVNVDGKVIKLITLTGTYSPKRNDMVIGRIVEILFSGWRVELNCPYQAILGLKDATSDFIAKGADLRQYFDLGDYVVTSITNVTSQKLIDVSMKGPGLRKLRGGRIIEVNPSKVPRIIGKAGSMISMIKNATGCRIIVGQNGLIWLSGEPNDEILAVETIKKIQSESHVSGLTDKIKQWLEEKTGKKLEEKAPEPKGEEQ